MKNLGIQSDESDIFSFVFTHRLRDLDQALGQALGQGSLLLEEERRVEGRVGEEEVEGRVGEEEAAVKRQEWDLHRLSTTAFDTIN